MDSLEKAIVLALQKEAEQLFSAEVRDRTWKRISQVLFQSADRSESSNMVDYRTEFSKEAKG